MIFIYRIYTVGINDTLDSIAQSLGIKSDDLRKINGFSDIHTIKYGDQIIIPTNDGNFKNYTILKGDNLYEIAKKHNTTVEQLKPLNGFDDDYLYPGEIIVVPNDNVKFYITSEGENLNKILNILGVVNPLENQNIYLLCHKSRFFQDLWHIFRKFPFQFLPLFHP